MFDQSVTLSVGGQALIEVPISSPVDVLRRHLNAADLVFANLETTVTTANAWPTKPRTLHTATPAAIVSLATLGLTDLGHANNHAFDLGPPGIEATRAAVAAVGLSLTGSGANLAEASTPIIRRCGSVQVAILAIDCGPQSEIVYASADRAGINRLEVIRRLAVSAADHAVLGRILAETGEDRRQRARAAVGFRTPLASGTIDFFGLAVVSGKRSAEQLTPNPSDLARIRTDISAAKAVADLVLVSIHQHHWEPEWDRIPQWYRTLAADLVDHGADLIVGTGVPILQPMFFHRGRPIFASLGNLIFHTHRPERYDAEGIAVWDGAFCNCRFDTDGLCDRIDILPLRVGRLTPAVNGSAPAPEHLTGTDATAVLNRLASGLTTDERARLHLAG